MILMGIDIVETSRINRLLQLYNSKFLERFLSPEEQKQAENKKYPLNWLSGRWAAKEAAFKALGTGNYKDFEVVKNDSGKPELKFHQRAELKIRELGINFSQLSISHCRDLAVAVVILRKD